MKAMTVFLVKKAGALYPAGDEDEEKLSAAAEGTMIKAKITQPRNLAKHKKLFQMLHKIMVNWPEGTDRPATEEKLLDIIKIKAGHVDYLTVSGQVFAVPASISFDNMDELAFDGIFQTVKDYGYEIIGFDPAA